ncbi:MAG: metallophosphatase family protein, partial [Muribaculaceae bacterium]|nr:metallophosphatase family protein [Muribaculaceae bacterium]
SIIRQLENVCDTVRVVSGNIDHGEVCRKAPEVQEFEIENIRVWMTHIGGYPGRYAPGVKKLLKEHAIRLMITGHSHILKVMFDNELDMLHINPGAAGYHGWQKERTLIKLVLDNGDMRDLQVIELGRKRL